MSRNNAAPTEESMIEFSEVFLSAIELSWRDPEFKKVFLNDPMHALQHYFHFNSPWNFRLFVKDPPEKDNEGRPYGWKPEAFDGRGAWHLPNNATSFGLPKPPEDPKVHAVALALYNDAGPMYLFSCC
jgi:ribosomally synthesized peptide (two-chain TOMM family)